MAKRFFTSGVFHEQSRKLAEIFGRDAFVKIYVPELAKLDEKKAS